MNSNSTPPSSQTFLALPGTLASCCKPSSGGGVVLMDTLLNGLGSNPGHKNGDHFKESYLSAAIPGRRIFDQPEKRKTDESLAAMKNWSARS